MFAQEAMQYSLKAISAAHLRAIAGKLVLAAGVVSLLSLPVVLPSTAIEGAKKVTEASQASKVAGAAELPGENQSQPGQRQDSPPGKLDTASGESIYSFKAKALNGEEISLAKYKNQVLLIVNTASHCGFTPQYAGLEALYEKYSPQGLSVLGFPCNQFAGQEKGSAEEISTFCQKNYGVTFQMFAKIDVNGKDADALYTYLKSEAPNDHSNIKWNFTKFLVGRDGKVFRRYGSMTSPESLSADIETLLAQPVSSDKN